MDTLNHCCHQKLADKLVELGIGERIISSRATMPWYVINIEYLSSDQFLSEPRVMAEAMRMVRNKSQDHWYRLMRWLISEYHSHNMVLSITSTCIEILEEES